MKIYAKLANCNFLFEKKRENFQLRDNLVCILLCFNNEIFIRNGKKVLFAFGKMEME